MRVVVTTSLGRPLRDKGFHLAPREAQIIAGAEVAADARSEGEQVRKQGGDLGGSMSARERASLAGERFRPRRTCSTCPNVTQSAPLM